MGLRLSADAGREEEQTPARHGGPTPGRQIPVVFGFETQRGPTPPVLKISGT